LISAKLAGDGRTPLVTQHALAAFIAEGHLVRHVRRMRRIYGERRRALLDTIASAPKGWLEPFPSVAGLHISLGLPSGADVDAFLGAASKRGAGAYAISRFAMDSGRQQGVVLGYGVLGEAEARLGAAVLVETAKSAAGGFSPPDA
jgi:GntR family transcriptional regulator/MocR family aminotransferase